MTHFEKAIQAPVICDICGGVMHAMYGTARHWTVYTPIGHVTWGRY